MRRDWTAWVFAIVLCVFSAGCMEGAAVEGPAEIQQSASEKPADSRETPPLAAAPFDAEQARAHQKAWSKHLGKPVEWTNSIGMKLVLIPPGEFMMGSGDSDRRARPDEKPQHRVRITRPFYLGTCEVTQAEYERVMAGNPSFSKGDPNLPVERVTWTGAVEFCRQLSELPKEKADGTAYRLPTEAEWEYACRAGAATLFSFGGDAEILGEYAWWEKNSQGHTQPVGQKKPNAWGLYDMHGNVWEWCADWFGGEYYAKSPQEDPAGPDSGASRVMRGASWCIGLPDFFRCAYRNRDRPDTGSHDDGFRVVRTLAP